MRQQTFRERGEERWSETEQLIARLERRRPRGSEALPALYRQLCDDLAIARDRMFDALLVERLNRLALRAHQQLYRGRSVSLNDAARWVGADFPLAVRRQAALLPIALLLFFGSLAATAFFVARSPALVYSVLRRETVRAIESMYDPASGRFLRPIDSESRFEMFGFYIMNNISIGFRVFAGGILFGVGSILILLYNGVFLGAVAGHLIRLGFGEPFLTFVSGHSGLELGAVVLLGVAGLRLGWALVSPREFARGDSLRVTARRCVALVPGAGAMLVLAAIVEAFWSPLALAPAVKYACGGGVALALAAYFLFGGRRRGLRADQRSDS